MSEPSANHEAIDHLIIDSVEQVRNRFGAAGLRQLIEVAQSELADTESALEELASPE